MWNGPTWPHAISLVAQGLGRVLRRSGERGAVSRDGLFELLSRYTLAHYQGTDDRRDFADPIVGFGAAVRHPVPAAGQVNEAAMRRSVMADVVRRLGDATREEESRWISANRSV